MMVRRLAMRWSTNADLGVRGASDAFGKVFKVSPHRAGARAGSQKTASPRDDKGEADRSAAGHIGERFAELADIVFIDAAEIGPTIAQNINAVAFAQSERLRFRDGQEREHAVLAGDRVEPAA